MNRHYWLWLFVADLLLELVAIAYQQQWLRYITKPLLLVFLLAHFLQNSHPGTALRFLIIAALLLSWAGDVFLLAEDTNPDFFIAGLGSFLLAHLFYIVYFLSIRKRIKPAKPWHVVVVLAVLIYALGLFFFLSPRLGALQLPVLIYALTIAAMLICSIHAYRIKMQRYGLWCIAGAILFVFSDSMLAINRFSQPFAIANIAVMFTYALAQLFIVTGALCTVASVDVKNSPAEKNEVTTAATG